MVKTDTESVANVVTFARRKAAPRILVADPKQHVRAFLCSTLQDLGFLVSDSDGAELDRLLAGFRPDLILISALNAGAIHVLDTLAQRDFRGSVVLYGPEDAPATQGAIEHGASRGLSMMQVLPTPFSDGTLMKRLNRLLHAVRPRNPAIHLGEALNNGWLELWYQPKIDVRSLAAVGAEALIRLRHPHWGVVDPAAFLPDERDPQFRALSEFVIDRSLTDWEDFVGEYGRIQLAVNLPITFFDDGAAVHLLEARMPMHPTSEGLLVEMTATDVAANLPRAKDLARQLRKHNIGISIDDLGEEWPSLLEEQDLPFVEIKIDRGFVSGLADDGVKRAICRNILDLADCIGARTVADGIETRGDFMVARELGFDHVQGFLFAKPAPAPAFIRTSLRRPDRLGQL